MHRLAIVDGRCWNIARRKSELARPVRMYHTTASIALFPVSKSSARCHAALRMSQIYASIPEEDTVYLVAMFFLFVLLSYLLFDPARKMLEKRKAFIQSQLDEAAETKADAMKQKEQ